MWKLHFFFLGIAIDIKRKSLLFNLASRKIEI